MVVSNAIQSLISMEERGGPQFIVDYDLTGKLLTGLDEASEWSQTIFLDAISRFEPENSRQAEKVIDRVQARVLSKNSGVVLSAVKVLMIMMENLDDPGLVRQY